jgi:hypothetical protein
MHMEMFPHSLIFLPHRFIPDALPAGPSVGHLLHRLLGGAVAHRDGAQAAPVLEHVGDADAVNHQTLSPEPPDAVGLGLFLPLFI